MQQNNALFQRKPFKIVNNTLKTIYLTLYCLIEID